MNIKSIHFRILVWYSLTIFLATAFVFSSFYFVTSRVLFQQVDQELTSHASKLSDIATRQSASSSTMIINHQIYNEFSNIPGMVTVLLDSNGNVVRSSLTQDTPFVSFNYLFDQAKNSSTPIYVNQIISSSLMRFIAFPIRSGKDTLGVILVAHPIEAIQKSLNSLLITLVIVFAIMIIPTILGGYLIASRIVQPILDISNKMAKITSEHLDERAVNPGSGDEIEKLVLTFNSLLDRLQDSFQRERQFIGDVAHELKTPIATLRSGIELSISKTRTKKEYKKSLSESVVDINRLSTTINNILDLAWLGANNFNHKETTFDLSSMMNELKEIAIKLAGQKHLSVKGKIESEIVMAGSEDKVARAVLNVIDNAIKYTTTGVVTISLRKKESEAVIQVIDHGQGITEKDLPHIFERFYRGAKVAKTLGSGLGLAITQGIIAVHKGRINVESKVGKGTTITIYLPLIIS